MADSEIAVSTNGPLRVSGKDIVLKDAAGNVFDLSGRDKISLCRCGASANKPFCDGAHRGANFESDTPACKLPPPKGS